MNAGSYVLELSGYVHLNPICVRKHSTMRACHSGGTKGRRENCGGDRAGGGFTFWYGGGGLIPTVRIVSKCPLLIYGAVLPVFGQKDEFIRDGSVGWRSDRVGSE